MTTPSCIFRRSCWTVHPRSTSWLVASQPPPVPSNSLPLASSVFPAIGHIITSACCLRNYLFLSLWSRIKFSYSFSFEWSSSSLLFQVLLNYRFSSSIISFSTRCFSTWSFRDCSYCCFRRSFVYRFLASSRSYFALSSSTWITNWLPAYCISLHPST